MRRVYVLAAILFVMLAAACGCATLQEIAALRSVAFSFDRVADVRVAGIAIGSGTGFANLGLADGARLAAAIVNRQVPLELVAHVRAQNPAENHVAARLVNVDWKLFVDAKETVGGAITDAVSIAPGQAADVPVAVRFDLLSLGGGGARDLFDTARSIAGYGGAAKELRLELVPTIDTSLGPIRYPSPVVVRRAAG
jgi:hypothetical protein